MIETIRADLTQNITSTPFDAAGNLLGDGTYSYTWDAEGRNVSASQSGTTVTTNTYNAPGQAAETYYPQYSDHIQYMYDRAGRTPGHDTLFVSRAFGG